MGDEEILMEKAVRKLEAARTLCEHGFYGDAVSRAYYAMFFAARALLSRRNIYPKTHRGLISQFGCKFVKNGGFQKEIFDILLRAYEDREEADYGILSEIDQKEAIIIIKGAWKFVEECKSFK